MMRTAMTGLMLLVAMQVFGRMVVWEALWSGVRAATDTQVAAITWWAWTGIQIGVAVAVGFSMARAGLGLTRRRRTDEGGALCERCGVELGLLEAAAA